MYVVESMEKYGGSFVKALAECFWHADPINFAKLKDAFINYWIEYEKFNKRVDEENPDKLLQIIRKTYCYRYPLIRKTYEK